MTARDLKDKINQVLDKMPDEVLEDVFKYLKSLTGKSAHEIKLSQNLGKILEEDKNLLERLAQ
jgi:hypothetical protein